MITFIYDGTFSGLLCVVFESYKRRTFPSNICKKQEFQLDLISNFIDIENNENNANRVNLKLLKLLSKSNYDNLFTAFNSCEKNKELIIFNYIKEIIDANKDISDNYGSEKIFAYQEILKRVQREVHRFKGFLRFKKLDNGVYYSVIEPDNIINDLILPHFIKRYKTMPFIIHDLKNGVISWYNTKSQKTIYNANIPKLNCNDDFEKIFKIYYDSVNIESRKNTKQMLNYMPKRYHKNLPEKRIIL